MQSGVDTNAGLGLSINSISDCRYFIFAIA